MPSVIECQPPGESEDRRSKAPEHLLERDQEPSALLRFG
jgi:hypothetical protein